MGGITFVVVLWSPNPGEAVVGLCPSTRDLWLRAVQSPANRLLNSKTLDFVLFPALNGKQAANFAATSTYSCTGWLLGRRLTLS